MNVSQNRPKAENLPNTNLFTEELTCYKINTLVEFENKFEEERFQLYNFYRNKKVFRFFFLLKFLFQALFLYRHVSDFSYFILIQVVQLSLAATIVYLYKSSKVLCDTVITRIQMLLNIQILLNLVVVFRDRQLAATEIMEVTIIIGLVNTLLFNKFQMTVLAVAVDLILIITFSSSDSIFNNLLCIIFSLSNLKFLVALVTVIFVFKSLERYNRRIWALFDSFKKSYYNMVTIYEKLQNPIFILSKNDKYRILYKNGKAAELFEQMDVHKKDKTVNVTRSITLKYNKK